MILPNKYISLEKSFLGLGAEVLKCIKKPIGVEELWGIYTSKGNDKLSFHTYSLVLTFLYIIGAISYTEDGRIYCENKSHENTR